MLIARFEIGELPPKSGEHHMIVYRAKQKWARAFGYQQRVPAVTAPVKRMVIVEFCRPSSQDMDIDNMHARLKVPLDVLTRAHGRKKIGIGLLWDDAPAYVDVHPFCVNTRTTRTIVTICEAGSSVDEFRAQPTQLTMEASP